MITVSDLSVRYSRRTILHSLDCTLKRGEFAALLGPNGSGKTTLLRTLSGILPPAGGSVHIDGNNIYTLTARDRARLCATVPQQYSGLDNVTVRDLVLMGRYAHTDFLHGYTGQDHYLAHEAMRRTGVLEFSDRAADSLSGGEQQRVLLARALAQNARILLLDEAASHLDVARTMQLYALLRDLNQQGTTILSVVHDLNLAALSCQRLIFLKHGRIVCDGPTRDVFTASNLSEIYETHIAVAEHPAFDAPQAHLIPLL